MKSYEQGRMDAWERIDAIKRRLGLAGFFNEQKIKRYPKGHPKAGEFMPKPKESKKPVSARKVLNLSLSPVETNIDGHKFKLEFKSSGNGVGIGFLANDEYSLQRNMDSSTKKKAALWWRRSAVNTLKMMPDGVPLRASAYDEDGGGQDRVSFYESLGFHSDGLAVSGITQGGKIKPVSEEELDSLRKIEIREIKGAGKPRRPYSQRQFEADLDSVFDRSSQSRVEVRSPPSPARSSEEEVNNALRALSSRRLFSNQ